MNASSARLRLWTTANHPLAAGIGTMLALMALLAALALLVSADVLLRGWLLAFAVWSSVPVGSTVLLLIHRLTGGAWGWAAAPVLRPAAALTPLVALGFLPIIVGLHGIYPWAADPSAIPVDVARWYLNGPLFAIRAIIALGGWSVLGVLFAAGIGSPLLAALGLAFFGLTISLVSVDWYLSLQPHYTATAFAAMIATQQLLAALAVTALFGQSAINGKAAGDLGALLLTTLLGVTYLELMTFIVAWYGDLPEKASWFVARSSPIWIGILLLALLSGAALPFFMLLVKRLRTSRRALRVVGGLIVVGTCLHFTWLLVPAFTAQAGPTLVACLALAGLTLASCLIGSSLRWSDLPERGHAE
jgi:hypothetical protein